MLHVAFLILASTALQQAPRIAVVIKEGPAKEGKAPPFICEGTTNLPDGAQLKVALFYDRVVLGRGLINEFTPVKGGKFSYESVVFPTRNLPGTYIVQILFDPELQNLNVSGFPLAKTEAKYQIGTPADAERALKAVRERLCDDIRGMIGVCDKLKAKATELRGKKDDPAWPPLLHEAEEKLHAIQKGAQLDAVPEYGLLNFDGVVTTGFENLVGTLMAAAQFALKGDTETAFEGFTRFRQTAEYYISEISSPKLTEPREIVALIESGRKLLKECLDRPDDVPAARRKFIEMTALLRKSLSEEEEAAILAMGGQAADFFHAVADRKPEAKTLFAELDKALEALAAPLRSPK